MRESVLTFTAAEAVRRGKGGARNGGQQDKWNEEGERGVRRGRLGGTIRQAGLNRRAREQE